MEEKKNTASAFNFYGRKKLKKNPPPPPPFAVMFLPLWFLEPDVSSSQFLATEP